MRCRILIGSNLRRWNRYTRLRLVKCSGTDWNPEDRCQLSGLGSRLESYRIGSVPNLEQLLGCTNWKAKCPSYIECIQIQHSSKIIKGLSNIKALTQRRPTFSEILTIKRLLLAFFQDSDDGESKNEVESHTISEPINLESETITTAERLEEVGLNADLLNKHLVRINGCS